MKTNLIIVFWKALEISYKNMQKHIGCPIEKGGGDLHITLTTRFEVIIMLLCNALHKTLKLLYETFFLKMRIFRNIKGFPHFWQTLYTRSFS